jgi:GTPase SAR1 family protein
MKKEELKNLIAKNETPKVIDILLQLLSKSDNNKVNEIVLLSLKNNSLKEQSRLGILSSEEFNLATSKINLALLNFIDVIIDDKIEPKTTLLFSTPTFKEYISNDKVISKVFEKLESAFCILVEGLSGSGKTYLVSELVQKFLNKKYKAPAIWFSAYDGCTIESFFIDLGSELNFTSSDTIGKFHELNKTLNSNDTILIIDDSDYIDNFIELVQKYSYNHSGKTRYILISKKSKLGNFDSSNFYFLKVLGFDRLQLNEYLLVREIDTLPKEIIDRLWESTDGLPLAISIFCTLVKSFSIDPDSLLRGDMLYNERIDSWYRKLMLFIGSQLEQLLNNLSLCEEPFNDSIVKIFCKKLNIENNEQALENLIRLFLIQQYSPYRWSIHKLISEKSKLNINESLRIKGYIELAKYSVKGYNYHKHKLFDEKELQWKIKAIRYFQKGEDFNTAGIILDNIARTAKTLGYYEIFLVLLKNQLLKHENSNIWLRYHQLHCLLIQGKHIECNRIFSKLAIETTYEKNLLLSFVRLKAELTSELGSIKDALVIMENHFEELNNKSIKNVTKSHYLSVLTGLYTENEDFERAIDTYLIWEKMNVDNKYEKAILQIRYAILMLKQKNFAFETEIIDESISIFQEFNDKRGLAWALSIKALYALVKGEIKTAQQHIIDSASIKKHIGDTTREYYNILNRIAPHFQNNLSNNLLFEEIKRLDKVYK